LGRAKPDLSSLHPQVIEARTQLAEARVKAFNLHSSGATGPQVCFAWADAVDAIVLRLIRAACEPIAVDPASFAFVAHGGYGRRDLAPFSDIDLMLLHRGLPEKEIAPVARNVSQMIVDAGFQLGFSVRTPFQCRQIAWTDATILTSLVEMRLLHGSEPFFDRFEQSLRRGVKWRWRSLAAMIEKERFDERQKYGETEFLLHPNIKRSRGCLRDVQIVRWIGFVCFGEKSPEQLVDMGLLSNEDYQPIRDGYNYLLQIRNQLHFTAGRAQDSLDRSKQIELAKWMGHQGTDGVLPVEEFMQTFFEKTSEVRYSSANFVGMARSRLTPFGFLARFLCLPVGKYLRLGIKEVWATPSGLTRLQGDPARVLELMQVANRHNRRIEHRTWRTIRHAMLSRPDSPVGNEAIERFLQLLSEPGRLGEILRRLHELRVLEQMIPAMKHARSLIQFNEYHKYTVDAHCIRSVEAACAFAKRADFLGPLYRGLKRKMILHLSLLLHDLGKGFTEDHSEVGKIIAEESSEKLRLSDQDRELVVFLVHQHLLMTHTAFRYDLTQKSTILRFAQQVGSLERLKLLTLLSCADLDAVGPGALNEWKLNLIHELYVATESQLRTGNVPDRESEQHATLRSAILAQRTIQERDDPWWTEQIAAIPTNYLTHLKPKDLAEELRRIQRLTIERPADAWATHLTDQNATEYVVAVHPDRSNGLFHRVTGALTSKGVSILSADIHTQPGPIAWDRFVVEDLDYHGAPPPHRLSDICQTIITSIINENSSPPPFRRTWKSKNTSDAAIARTQPTQIRFDNTTSEDYTIVTVFAYDRTGLLYDISKTLFDLQLDLQVAKVSTHLDQVVDVFYVTDVDGQKVSEPTRLYTLRQTLLRAIEKQFVK
jgi:[protein-PII] uridylyltransferase